jgi:hypothetical protein
MTFADVGYAVAAGVATITCRQPASSRCGDRNGTPRLFSLPWEVTASQSLAIHAGVRHTFDAYQGDHTNRIRERFERRVLPFVSRKLAPP